MPSTTMQSQHLNSTSSPFRRWLPYQAIFKLTMRRILWSWKTIFTFLMTMLPVALSIVLHFVRHSSRDAREFVPIMTMMFYLMFAVILIALLYGTAIIADEIDNKTLTYLFMRPLRKSSILLSKFAAYFVGTVTLIAPSHLLMTLIVAADPKIKADLLFQIGMSFKYLGVVSLGLLAYGAIFTLLGVRFKHAVLWGLLVAFGWEKITLAPLGNIKKFSVIHYLLTIYPRHSLPEHPLQDFLGDSPPTFWGALLIIFLITILFLSLSIWVFQQREYHREM